MNRTEAIRWFNEIGNGEGVDRDAALSVVRRGSIAERRWDEGEFVLGVEYGAMIALARVFGLTRAEIEAAQREAK